MMANSNQANGVILLKINIPPFVKEIIQQILDHRYSAYLVGGSVRDSLLHIQTDDYDIATSALPSDVKEIFKSYNTYDFGERHGTIGLVYHGTKFEITTFREEEGYSDGRRPDKIKFVRNLESDLKRRDFTVNALAADINGEIIDIVNGIEDFNNSILRAVGIPDHRFREDSLRILRAVRFASRLNFSLEEKTKEAIINNKDLLIRHAVSGERILMELQQIFENPKNGYEMLYNFGLLDLLFPKITHRNYYEQLMSLFSKITQTIPVHIIWAVLFSIWLDKVDTIEKRSYINLVFTKFPGIGKKKIQEILDLIYFGKLPVTQNDTYVLKLWLMYPWMNFDQNRSLSLFLKQVKQFNVVLGYQGDISIFNDFVNQISKMQYNNHITGEQILQIGYSGNQVGLALKFSRVIQLFHMDLQSYQILELLKNPKISDLSPLIRAILKGFLDEKLASNVKTILIDFSYVVAKLLEIHNISLNIVLDLNKMDIDNFTDLVNKSSNFKNDNSGNQINLDQTIFDEARWLSSNSLNFILAKNPNIIVSELNLTESNMTILIN